MPRQSITLSPKNDAWLKDKSVQGEFQSKSEIINSLVRDARKEEQRRDFVIAALIEAEQGETTPIDADSIRNQVKQDLRSSGKL